MARQMKHAAKRANRPNPREDRNTPRTRGSAARSSKSENEFDDSKQKSFKSKRVELIPRNISQEMYLDVLEDETKSIVFAMGPAGTGKTLLATLFAIQGLQQGLYDKIIITRPAVSVDEQHGFLPGDLTAKMAPWVLPLMDIFKEHYSPQGVERMLADEVIEVAPLAFMRGRTLKRAMILFDEAQNATPNQMKMVLTRIGEGSRMIITGDVKQHDRGFEVNGLKDFIERLGTRSSVSSGIAVVNFHVGDVERHPIITEVLSLYGEE